MPTSADLIQIVADACGMKPASVGTVYRRLRETNLIGEGGRGRNAMLLDLADATMVAIGSLASGEARDAPEAIATIYDLRASGRQWTPSESTNPLPRHVLKGQFFERLALSEKPRSRTFGVAVDRLMAALASGQLTPEPLDEDYLRREGPVPAHPHPFALCEIRSSLTDGNFRVVSASLEFGLRGVYRASADFRPVRQSRRSRDEAMTLNETRSVGLPTLARIASHFAAKA